MLINQSLFILIFKRFFFFFNYLAVVCLHCLMQAFSSRGEQVGVGTLHCNARASYRGNFSCYGAWAVGVRAQWSQLTGPRAQVQKLCHPGLSCWLACGIFLDQGSNLCPFHCKANS